MTMVPAVPGLVPTTSESIRGTLIDHATRFSTLLSTMSDQRGPVHRQLVSDILRGYDELYEQLADPPTTPTASTVLTPSGYTQLVVRWREQLPLVAPARAIVGVISRGDRSLVDVPGVAARHFPDDDLGQWAGFHPADDADALRRLQDAQGRGVSHLAVPATCRWWLTYYTGLAEHLGRTATTIRDDEVMTVFELLGHVPTDHHSHRSADAARYTGRATQFADLAASILPSGATLAVVSRGDPAFLAVTGIRTTPFPARSDGTYDGHPVDSEDAIHRLADLVADTRFLGIPSPFAWWDEIYPAFIDRLEHLHTCLARQPEAGRIYQLTP